MKITIKNDQGKKFYLKFENGEDIELAPHSEVTTETEGDPVVSIGYDDISTQNIRHP